uniref:B30.2/SPRY domain-containing protein n=1 Tax=Scleropages formosus TaxID=113540 RepID=A0A8C9TXH6_SCLFO
MTKQSHISRYLYTYMVYFTSQTKKKSYFTYIDCDFQIQARDTEKQIKEEYERIYQFLRDEERSRLIALRKEEEENTRRVMEMMDNISKHISTLSGKIESTERRLMRDDITFLKTYKDTKERLDFKLQDPELLSGVPIDANKHLEPLKLRVKKIMEHILSLPDLTTALNTGDEQQPSDNTETPGHLGFVLASEGFTSGKHSWEVEVGDSPSWAVGVLEEPINKERKITFRPDSGFWALMLKNGEYQAGYTRLEVKKKPEKIGVELDYDNRQVSFFNSTDKSCIISLENKCSEKLFPFVCPWITGTEQNHEGLQISILKVKFLTEKIRSFLNIPWPKLPSINTTSKPAPVLSLPDLTTALNTGDEPQPSDNTETPGHLGFVLASEGFTSGKHSWEVEVGDSPSWAVGVLEEPINKKRKITFRPDSGFWALMLKNGEYKAGYTRLEVKKKPEKIRVELDYDNRQVSFFNSTDKSCIISLENKCSEKLFPFVCPWITGTEQNHEGLQISILKVKFLTEKISSFFSIPGPKSPSINTTSKPAPGQNIFNFSSINTVPKPTPPSKL